MTNEGPFLFIGGPLDGQTQRIPEGQTTVRAGEAGDYEGVTYLRYRLSPLVAVFIEIKLLARAGGDAAKLLVNRYAAMASEIHRQHATFDSQSELGYGDMVRVDNLSLGLKKYLVEPERLPPKKDF